MIGRDDRGVHPVIGAVLLTVITVLLVSVLGAMALGFDAPGEPAPRVSTSSGFEPAGGAGSGGSIVVRHQAGDTVDTDDLEVVVTKEDGSSATVDPVDADGDGVWTAGEQLAVPAEAEDLCGGGESAELRLVYQGEKSSTTMMTETVPLRASQFTIDDGSVTVDHEYDAEVEVAYTGLTMGANGEHIDIAVDVELGGTQVHHWADVNDGTHGQTETFTDRNPGDDIAVVAEGKSGEYDDSSGDSHVYGGVTRRSTDDVPQVQVLRDGDSAPTGAGLGDQSNVEDTIDEYITDGNITLEDNQAIYLFELGSGDPDDTSYDMQDTVVVVTLWSSSDEPRVVEEDGESRIVCGV